MPRMHLHRRYTPHVGHRKKNKHKRKRRRRSPSRSIEFSDEFANDTPDAESGELDKAPDFFPFVIRIIGIIVATGCISIVHHIHVLYPTVFLWGTVFYAAYWFDKYQAYLLQKMEGGTSAILDDTKNFENPCEHGFPFSYIVVLWLVWIVYGSMHVAAHPAFDHMVSVFIVDMLVILMVMAFLSIFSSLEQRIKSWGTYVLNSGFVVYGILLFVPHSNTFIHEASPGENIVRVVVAILTFMVLNYSLGDHVKNDYFKTINHLYVFVFCVGWVFFVHTWFLTFSLFEWAYLFYLHQTKVVVRTYGTFARPEVSYEDDVARRNAGHVEEDTAESEGRGEPEYSPEEYSCESEGPMSVESESYDDSLRPQASAAKLHKEKEQGKRHTSPNTSAKPKKKKNQSRKSIL